jgi:hypothetical protein
MRKPELSDFLSLYSCSTLILIAIMFVLGIVCMIFPELNPVTNGKL